MPSSSRALGLGRRSLIAVVAGAGVALTPLAAAPASAATSAAAPSAAAQTIVNTALAQQGDPYRWGAAGPNAFDCSGLAQYAAKAAGITLPHSSKGQSQMGRPVAKSDLKPGDLVFYYSPVSHVAVYVGNGKIVHASTYGQPVKVVDMAFVPGYNSARRLA
jgi:cell wall-associated NlpC family hydrolase